MVKGSPRSMVTTMTPLRLSFLGGGTDLRDFYSHDWGAVLSMAINKHIYVTVKRHGPLFREKYRLNYFVTENTDSLDEIKNDIAREGLRLLHVDPPLYINTIGDLPAGSGLASSSSFAVGLLYALHALRGEEVSAGQLAEEACEVEIGRLKRSIGKQDQYAAAFGGLNLIVFHPNESVTLDPVWLRADDIDALHAHGMLFWTGMVRDAGAVLSEQRDRIVDTRPTLIEMRDDALRLRDLWRCGFDPKRFGELLDINWQRKRQLASGISDASIDGWYKKAMDAGAYGGKLAGAGGGGFLYMVVPPERQPQVRAALADLTEISASFEPRGSRILYVEQ